MKTMTENIAGACIITRTLLNNSNKVEPRGTETSLIRTVSNVIPIKFSYIFSLKKTSIIRTQSL